MENGIVLSGDLRALYDSLPDDQKPRLLAAVGRRMEALQDLAERHLKMQLDYQKELYDLRHKAIRHAAQQELDRRMREVQGDAHMDDEIRMNT